MKDVSKTDVSIRPKAKNNSHRRPWHRFSYSCSILAPFSKAKTAFLFCLRKQRLQKTENQFLLRNRCENYILLQADIFMTKFAITVPAAAAVRRRQNMYILSVAFSVRHANDIAGITWGMENASTKNRSLSAASSRQ